MRKLLTTMYRMKDGILIFMYELRCVLESFAIVFLSLFGIKTKKKVKVGLLDKFLMIIILLLFSVLTLLILKYDDILSMLI